MKLNKTMLIVIILLIILIGGLFFYFKGAKKVEKQGIVVDTSNTVTNSESQSTEEYSALDSSDQVLTEIDESLEYLE
ncbi:hypothetical protein J4456_01355 [Candidatus Pacearchaeota archaeon]|nr:hypothetical protein [Candidatus Pacearchaeota archaeon]